MIIVRRYNIILLLVLYLCTVSCCAAHTQVLSRIKNTKNVQITGQEKKRNTIVTFLKDDNGNRFCVKQIDTESATYLFSFIRGAVAARIAAHINAPVVNVDVIPASMPFPGKIFPQKLASLQTVAVGSNSNDLWPTLRLQQGLAYDGAPAEIWGLHRDLIYSMSLHPDLPVMVALDTFTSNSERTSSNWFYDKKTDRFSGIDLEASFRLPCERNVAEAACKSIQQYLRDKKFCVTKQEIEGLKRYNNTLKILVQKATPAVMYRVLDEVVTQSEFMPSKIREWDNYMRLQGKKVEVPFRAWIEAHKKKIQAQYNSAKELTMLLDRLIEQHH